MNARHKWIVEALASRHGDDAFREAYQAVGPPKTVNARLEALLTQNTGPLRPLPWWKQVVEHWRRWRALRRISQRLKRTVVHPP